jgi:hypothetical protein
MRAVPAILIATALVGATGCAVTQKSLEEKGLRPLTQKELEDRYSRPVKVRFVNARNQSGTGDYNPDGSVRLSWQGGGANGRWRIKDGKFCTTYAEIRNGVETCFTSYRTGPKEYVSFGPDGYAGTTTQID